MGNTNGKTQQDLRDQAASFDEVLREANISGNTWKELTLELRRRYREGKQLEKEWQFLSGKEMERALDYDRFDAAKLSLNKDKNRYMNILPLDATRVKLSGTEGSDYINANYVKTPNGRVYICCQAPLETTIEDFHRMLWESDCKIIVMLTRHIEDGRVKASEYLSELNEDPKKYGEFYVEVTDEQEVNGGTCIIRKFKLRRVSEGDNGETTSETRQLTQYHFVAWPDHGVPMEPKQLLTTILQVNKTEDLHEKKVPTVVHCSAGIGRTGTYVIVNSILEVLTQAIKKDKNKPPSINIMKTVDDVRNMRSGMVNHFDQYQFCYHTVLAELEILLKDELGEELPPEDPEKEKEVVEKAEVKEKKLKRSREKEEI